VRTATPVWLFGAGGRSRRRRCLFVAVSALTAVVVAQATSFDVHLAAAERGEPSVAVLDAAPVTFPAPTWSASIGPIALSSPTVAEIDGVDAVVFGSEDGELYVVNAETGANLPGWPEPVTLSGGAPTAIESSPTVAYLDGPSNPPTIIVGAGSTYVRDQQGGLVAFRANGSVLFTFHTRDIFNEWNGTSTPGPDGFDEGVFSTPAVGDITGSGQQDIVFGSYDHDLYALTPDGDLVPGFPLDTQDTIWSSPALYHVRGKAGQVDIFTGGDASGRLGCYGGFLYDITYESKRPRIVWQHCKNQTIWSSPAVGVINSSGRAAVVVGTGFGETPPYKSDTDELFAYYAKNGARVPGWPVATAGPTFGSPAIGPLGASGSADVVDTSWCTKCASSPGSSMVYAWSGTGTLLWSQTLQGEQDFASPILVDLTGSGTNDVIVGSAAGLFPLDGGTGEFLYGTSATSGINTCSEQTTPSVVDVPGTGSGAGWHLFETCGGPVELIATGRLFDYPLPVAPAVLPPWPMWRGDVAHDGQSP
jgi:outer membrane protein assembly factor BamB